MPPTPPSTVLKHYQRIAALSRQMLVQAQAQQWDEVIRLGARYTLAIERLRELEPLDDADRALRRKLLTQILDDDMRIRLLATPELQRLQQLLGTTKRQRDVLQTYHMPSE